MMKLWIKEEERFYEMCGKIGKMNLGELSDAELMKLHDSFLKTGLERNSSSSIIDGFALGTDEMLAAEIKKSYDNSGIKKKFGDVFSALTAPVHLSFVNEAELSLLRVAMAKEDDGKEMLRQHQSDFFWIRNNYVDANVLDRQYFGKELKKIIKHIPDIRKEYVRVNNAPSENARRKHELISSLGIGKELKMLIKVSEDFTHWQDERKKATMWTAHYATLILKEISRRTGVPTELMKYMTPREVSNIFKNHPTNKQLEERRRNSVVFWDKEGHEVLVGKEADEVKKEILGETELSKVDDFRGLTAMTGTARGKVKIVKSAKEIDKVKKGDILVAVMTRPDYVPAMKRAAAIVTNEGGVTCHAAIISRELGIPCVIGTKIATNVLKDGDTVEVRANHGWVRIIDS
ncbi:MAG: hypothetical protein KJ709_05405 [Nanoarchaeota archaeon]|nr:hypothetical protein [Nanoarchaeota archaeon]